MKNIILYSLLVCWVMSACSAEKSSESNLLNLSAPVEVIDLAPEEFARKSREGILVDVRTPAEVSKGIIAGSLAMDYNHPDFLSQAIELPKDREIYLYCAIGGRSSKASELLIQQGFTKVYNLQGGIGAWEKAGFPVTRPE